MAEGVEESRSKRRPPCNGADRARASGRGPARKGADFRQVSAEAMDLDASTGRRRSTVRAEQTDGRQPMTGSSVDWTATEAVVGRIQNRIFRAATIKRPRLEPDDEQSSCPVLRGLGSGNGARLPDVRPELPVPSGAMLELIAARSPAG